MMPRNSEQARTGITLGVLLAAVFCVGLLALATDVVLTAVWVNPPPAVRVALFFVGGVVGMRFVLPVIVDSATVMRAEEEIDDRN